MKLKKIIECLEKWAPPIYQESYDNSGLMVGDSNSDISGCLISLDCTEKVIDEAISKKCNLIVSHHPIIFGGITSINSSHWVGRVIQKAISNDINIYEKKLVKLGVAEIGNEIKPGEIFPIEANLDYLNGIDFQKGCFIGQEVCSRMYRKGKVKKRIVSFKSNDNFTNNDELVYNDRTIGTVIKKIEDYGIALIKIDKLINPEREKITITSKTEKKNIEINLPKFFPV